MKHLRNNKIKGKKKSQQSRNNSQNENVVTLNFTTVDTEQYAGVHSGKSLGRKTPKCGSCNYVWFVNRNATLSMNVKGTENQKQK